MPFEKRLEKLDLGHVLPVAHRGHPCHLVIWYLNVLGGLPSCTFRKEFGIIVKPNESTGNCSFVSLAEFDLFGPVPGSVGDLRRATL